MLQPKAADERRQDAVVDGADEADGEATDRALSSATGMDDRSLGLAEQASRFLKQESSYGQNYVNDKDPGGSYGPFQLNMQPGSLGAQFQQQTGEDPRDPRTWRDQIVFALRYAQTHGWNEGWYTSANILRIRPGDGMGNPNQQFAWNYGQNNQTATGTTPTGDSMTPNWAGQDQPNMSASAG